MRKFLFICLFPLGIGLVLLWVSYKYTPAAELSNWLPATVMGGAVALIAFTCGEAVLTFAKRFIREAEEKAFTGLFGISMHETAAIVLQADRIDKIVGKLFRSDDFLKKAIDEPTIPHLKEAASSERSNRLFKARRWVNAHDADGARELRDAFREAKFEAPTLIIEGRKDEKQSTDKYGLVIFMGLGFTDDTTRVVDEVCKGWLKIDPATECGDAIALSSGVGLPPGFRNLSHPDGYTRLIPEGWDKDRYLETPDQLNQPKTNMPSAQSGDYAIILRNTNEFTGQTQFILAGFTAHGTFAAARYLAEEWHNLWTKFVKNCKYPADGDFCEIIIGTSGGDDWRPVYKAARFTPEKLAGLNIDESSWVSSFRKRHPEHDSGRGHKKRAAAASR